MSSRMPKSNRRHLIPATALTSAGPRRLLELVRAQGRGGRTRGACNGGSGQCWTLGG